jgi:NAD(P)-dependent dehydrogenase (short-subunit alcohol dehydrogenase family)
MAKVLIIGASHGIGLETVKAALRAGHSVRASARSAAIIPIQDAKMPPLQIEPLFAAAVVGACCSSACNVR